MDFSASKELKKHDEYYPNSDLSHVYARHRDEIVLVLQAIETVWQNRSLDKHNFDILYRGLQNSWIVVYYYVIGEQLNLMIGKIAGVEDLIIKGIEDRNWKTRFNTMVIMKVISNKEIQKKVVDLGLKDKSKKVREMASDVKDRYLP